MVKLTDSQLIVLSSAAARDDGLALTPRNMNKAAASKVGSSLVARKLMREIRSKPGMPVWRHDEDDRPISLMIARAGRNAIGVEDETVEEAAAQKPGRSKFADKPAQVSGRPVSKSHSKRRKSKQAGCAAIQENANAPADEPRSGSKQLLIVTLLSAPSGASIDELIKATGWLPHTTRAALTGLRKRGFSIERSRDDGKPSIYRIVGGVQASVGA